MDNANGLKDSELRAIEKRWQNLRAEAVGGIAKQACVDVQALVDELRRRDKAHRQAADQENAIAGALLGPMPSDYPNGYVSLFDRAHPKPDEDPTKLKAESLLVGRAGGHWIELQGDMDEVERVLQAFTDLEGLHFHRGDEVGYVGYADYERRFPAYLAQNDLWDYLVANLPNNITISGWHNASHTTMGGQRKETPE